MKIKIKKTGSTVDLQDRHFLASGGEGSVYRIKDQAYKIYHEQKNAISEKKIRELSVLVPDEIIKPISPLLRNNKLVGYSMNYVNSHGPLFQLFNKKFKRDNNLNQKKIVDVIRDLHELVSYVHSTGILIVDLNECNFLIGNDLDKVYAIDVDSYQTPGYPCKAIMPSVRDYSTNTYTEESDWFSFGVIAFRLLCGIHPFKGTHSEYNKIKMVDRMETRMKDHVSVYDPKVTVPSSCDVHNLPKELKKWFVEVFDKGERAAPPKDYNAVVQQVTQTISTNHLKIELIKHLTKPVSDAKIVRDRIGSGEYISGLDFDKLFMMNGEVYGTNNNNVLRIDIYGNNLGTTKIAELSQFELTTKYYENVIYQNLLGKHTLLTVVNRKMFYIDFNDDFKELIDASLQYNVLHICVKTHSGEYEKRIVVLDDQYRTKKQFVETQVNDLGINMAVLDNGLTFVSIDDKLLVVRAGKLHTVLDDVSNYSLWSDDNKLYGNKNKEVYSLTL